MFPWRRPQHPPHLLEIQPETLGRAQQDRRRHYGHVNALTDDFAARQYVQAARPEVLDPLRPQRRVHAAVHAGGPVSGRTERLGDVLGVSYAGAERDGRLAGADRAVMLQRHRP